MIVARTFSTTADTALINNAVNMAVANRNHRGATILHADHGSQPVHLLELRGKHPTLGPAGLVRHRRRLLR